MAPADAEEPILHGFIDCLYQDAEGRWHVLDYKTNRVAGGDVAAVAARYEMQLLLYALAAEQILSQPPASAVLHFLRTGQEFEQPYDDDARQRLVDFVTAATSAG
jgi:ATP-dependent helicase/nuclease subunit A